jgi:preprotein translocase subunit SecB
VHLAEINFQAMYDQQQAAVAAQQEQAGAAEPSRIITTA